jgi:protocatechuate 3,4-dioxygenase alpha subunit
VFARGLLDRLVTRIYFPGGSGGSGHAADPVLAAVPEERRRTLVAVREGTDGSADRAETYRFDIALQGPDETVFFDL